MTAKNRDYVLVHKDPDKLDNRFILNNGTLITVNRSFLEREVAIAASDPDRVVGEHVKVPVSWLVGGRVGY